MSEKETYLGDGLYASFDGYQIKLRAPRPEGDHEVFLEPPVYYNLIIFVDELRKRGGHDDRQPNPPDTSNKSPQTP